MDVNLAAKSSPEMRCPHCTHELTVKEAITILNGTGFKRMVPVRLPDGQTTFLEAGIINPHTVEILESPEQFIQRPNVIGDASSHSGRDAQGLMDAAEVVESEP